MKVWARTLMLTLTGHPTKTLNEWASYANANRKPDKNKHWMNELARLPLTVSQTKTTLDEWGSCANANAIVRHHFPHCAKKRRNENKGGRASVPRLTPNPDQRNAEWTLFWHHKWACPPRCVLDRPPVYQLPTRWTVAEGRSSIRHTARWTRPLCDVRRGRFSKNGS